MSQKYPTPDIQLFLARIEDSLRPIFSPAQLKKYQAAVNAVFLESPPLDVAGKALQKIEADHPASDNWHSSFFSTVYGRIRFPVASTNWLSLRLNPPVPPTFVDPQIYSTARYLRAIGIWAVHLHDGQTFTPAQKVLKLQMDGYLHTFREPGSKVDKLHTLPIPDDINVAVFYHGVPHLVQIARSRVVLSVDAISSQLTHIKAQEAVSIQPVSPALVTMLTLRPAFRHPPDCRVLLAAGEDRVVSRLPTTPRSRRKSFAVRTLEDLCHFRRPRRRIPRYGSGVHERYSRGHAQYQPLYRSNLHSCCVQGRCVEY